jgi:hypothetical protein
MFLAVSHGILRRRIGGFNQLEESCLLTARNGILKIVVDGLVFLADNFNMNIIKAIRTILVLLILPILAGFLSYSAQSNYFLETTLAPIKPVVDFKLLKDKLLLLAIIFQFSLTLQIVFLKLQKDNLSNQRDKAIEYHKKLFLKSLEKDLGTSSSKDLNVRIFLPCRFFKYKKVLEKLLFGKVKLKKYFRIKNIKYLTDSEKTENLRLIVEPKEDSQGLVGKCYNSKKIIFNTDLKNNNDNYKLDKDQLARTSDLNFCLCFPLFNQNDVIAIISFDSNQKINNAETKKDIWEKHVTNYSNTLYDNFSYLFK